MIRVNLAQCLADAVAIAKPGVRRLSAGSGISQAQPLPYAEIQQLIA